MPPAPFREFPLPATAQGGTHVLLIGVDGYHHLPAVGGAGGDENVKRLAPGLHQLNTSVLSVERLASWFLAGAAGQPGFQCATHPLASIDILLSPGRFTEAGKDSVEVLEATFRNIRDAVRAWRDRAHTKEQNHALFFMVGHGMEGLDHYLLPADVFEDVSVPGEKLIKLNTLISNMGSCRAGIQMFFVDACRSELGDKLLKAEIDPDFCAPFLQAQSSRHPRHVPLYRAAQVKGRPAVGRNQQPTFFTEGVLDCLNHHGADDNQGDGAFWVTVNSLRVALDERMKRLSRLSGHALNSDFTDKSHEPPEIDQNVHQIPDADCRVQARLNVIPDTRFADTHLRMEGGSVLMERSPAANDLRVWLTELPPGSYNVSARDQADTTKVLATSTAEFRMPVDERKFRIP